MPLLARLNPALPLSSSTPPTALGVIVLGLLAVLVAVIVVGLARRPEGFQRHGTPWWRQVLVGAVAGAVVGAAVLLFIAPYRIPGADAPTWLIRGTGLVGFAALGVAVANLRRTNAARKVVAASSVVVLALVAVVAADIGRIDPPVVASTTQAASTSVSSPLLPRLPKPPHATSASKPTVTVAPTPDLSHVGYAVASTLYRTWHAPAGMPKVGRLESVSIPGTVSHFAARPAEVYLPPAALVKNAPQLPVVILLSGQPASPTSVIVNGNTVTTLNALASRDHGLAPIMVVPDQLGQPQVNPMCVDGPLGHVRTYITTDVVDWIRTHLHVMPSRDAWAIGGFSEGGTCSIQFASEFPTVFGSFIDVSGEQYPTLSSDATAIADDFGGSALLYDRAKPLNVMAAHGPYTDMVAVFTVGSEDRHYGRIMPIMAAAAASHGIHVARYISQGTAHDWTTASNGFAAGIGTMYWRFGLAAAGQFVAPYRP